MVLILLEKNLVTMRFKQFDIDIFTVGDAKKKFFKITRGYPSLPFALLYSGHFTLVWQ